MVFKMDNISINNSIAATLKVLLFLIFLTLISCQQSPDFEALRSEILDIHKSFIEAHWQKDVDFFIKNMAEVSNFK